MKFKRTIDREIFATLCGEQIGSGIARKVYECAIDPSLVIKIENGSQSFQNVMEWENWKSWEKATNIKKWLAPCVSISPCGLILIQKKTSKVNKWPEKIPAFMTDRKKDNFGLYENRFVCHDYSYMISSVSEKMTKSKFW